MGGQLAHLLILAFLFNALLRVYSTGARLPPTAYHKRSFLLSLATQPAATLTLAATLLPALLAWKSLEWSRLDHGVLVRWFTTVLCLLATRTIIFAPTNRFFKQAYVLDRFVIASLAVLTIWHPAFLTVFVFAGTAFHSQIAHPPLTPWLESLSSLRPTAPWLFTLICVVAWLFGIIAWHGRAIELVILFSVLHSATYFWSAVDKIRLSWLQWNQLTAVLNTAIAHRRWRLGPRLTAAIASILKKFNRPLLAATLLLEIAVPLAWFHVAFAVSITISLIVFHWFVSWISGIDFRSWATLSLLQGFMLVSVGSELTHDVGWLVAAAVLLGVAPALLSPFRLAWLDAPLCSLFEFVIVEHDGHEQALEPSDFGPYDVIFGRNDFKFLADKKLAVDTWGETFRADVVASLAKVTSVTDLRCVEERVGINHYDKRRTEMFDYFVRKFFHGRQSARDVLVFLKTCHFDGTDFRAIERELVHTVNLLSQETRPAAEAWPRLVSA